MASLKRHLFTKICKNYIEAARRFKRDDGGNIALLFAAAIIPAILAVGTAVDYSRASQVKTAMQTALDSTALHLGLLPHTTPQAEYETEAVSYFAANYQGDFGASLGTIGVVKDGVTITLTLVGQLDTMFMGIASIHDMDVNVVSEVLLGGGTIEIAYVLDNSGSMSGSKISALKTAASGLVSTLYDSLPSNSTDLSFALVPFATFVDIGESNANQSWMDTNAQSPVHSANFNQSANRFDLFDNFTNVQWEGCVEARPYPHDVQDTAPTSGNPETLFVPAFAPDEPDNYSPYYLNYMNDSSSGSELARQEHVVKYDSPAIANSVWPYYSGHNIGPSFLCNQRDLLQLTTLQSTIETNLENMMASGGTDIVQGLVWGWRTLSPSEPFTSGRAYSDPRNQKILILLTDGKNTYNGMGNQNGSLYSAYGFAKEGRLGTTSSNSTTLGNAMNGRTAEACVNIKAAGILIYTITFDLSDPDTLQLMSDCATSSEYYYDSPTVSQLDDVFEEIAAKLLKLRLSK